jgi:Spy/CpxP family protein refolding chaperone
VESALYPTELVMDHQAALGLTDAQASAIREELQRTQRELVDAEWELRREREALASELAHPRVDEEAALAAAEQVIAREGAIKRLHLRLLVRIKNQLTAEQQARLDELRD